MNFGQLPTQADVHWAKDGSCQIHDDRAIVPLIVQCLDVFYGQVYVGQVKAGKTQFSDGLSLQDLLDGSLDFIANFTLDVVDHLWPQLVSQVLEPVAI